MPVLGEARVLPPNRNLSSSANNSWTWNWPFRDQSSKIGCAIGKLNPRGLCQNLKTSSPTQFFLGLWYGILCKRLHETLIKPFFVFIQNKYHQQEMCLCVWKFERVKSGRSNLPNKGRSVCFLCGMLVILRKSCEKARLSLSPFTLRFSFSFSFPQSFIYKRF